MPCLFFENLPDGIVWIPEYVAWLQHQIAHQAVVPVEEVELHLTNVKYHILKRDGTLEDKHGVHVFVEWHEGRNLYQKQEIAYVIHRFLGVHGIGKGSDITFRDSPSETFFYEGVLVPGGHPRV